MFFVDLRSADSGDPERVAARDHVPVGGQKAVTGVNDGDQALAEERQNPVDVGNNHIRRFGQGAFRGHFRDEFNALGEAVGGGNFPGKFDNSGGLEGIDTAGTEAAGQKGKDSRSGTNINYDVAGFYELLECLGVGIGTDLVGDHLAIGG